MKRWWKSEDKVKVDVLKDIEALLDFLKDVSADAKELIPELQKLQELEKERLVANTGLLQVNLETQAEVLERILQRYEFFQNDVDINGNRVKEMAEEFLRRAEHAGLKDLVKEKKKGGVWRLRW